MSDKVCSNVSGFAEQEGSGVFDNNGLTAKALIPTIVVIVISNKKRYFIPTSSIQWLMFSVGYCPKTVVIKV
jgi:hypothetical protein